MTTKTTTKTTMQHAVTAALALATLAVLTAAAASLRTPVAADAVGAPALAQFCVPPDDAVNVHTFYCRNGQG